MILNNTNIRNQINGTKYNHIGYTDYVCLISIAFTGMQTLLNICEEYDSDRDVIYSYKIIKSIVYVEQYKIY